MSVPSPTMVRLGLDALIDLSLIFLVIGTVSFVRGTASRSSRAAHCKRALEGAVGHGRLMIVDHDIMPVCVTSGFVVG